MVLPRQSLHERAHLGRDRWPSRRAWIGPFPLDQAPVPGQRGPRRHDPVQPQAPGQDPGQGGQHGTVSPVRPWPGALPPQDRDLMPQYEDLRVLRGIAAGQQRQPADTWTMNR
jgi:hypothetical protein